ncbi:hypothetical protein E2C01_031469 [Portunus trituberculatus]|uniref:Uncharacterized protein n=1 Tax=Portunus trituberculatus TaxID=210409 RepID=A0A5B7F061_PORTR|nr:hypothetical protein [Portunus trituberculatus]
MIFTPQCLSRTERGFEAGLNSVWVTSGGLSGCLKYKTFLALKYGCTGQAKTDPWMERTNGSKFSNCNEN